MAHKPGETPATKQAEKPIATTPVRRPLPDIPALPGIAPVEDPVSPVDEFFGVYMSALSGVPGATERSIQLIADQTKLLRDRRERAATQRTNIALGRRQEVVQERRDIFAERTTRDVAAADIASREKIAGLRRTDAATKVGRDRDIDLAKLEQKDLELTATAQRNLDISIRELEASFPDIPVTLDVPEGASVALMTLMSAPDATGDQRRVALTGFLTNVLQAKVDAVSNVSKTRRDDFVRKAVGLIGAHMVSVPESKQTQFILGNIRARTEPEAKVIQGVQLTPQEGQAYVGEMSKRLTAAWEDDKILSVEDATSLAVFFRDYQNDPNFMDYMDQSFTTVADHIAEMTNRPQEDVRADMTQFLQDAVQTGEARIGMADLLLDRVPSPFDKAFGAVTDAFGFGAVKNVTKALGQVRQQGTLFPRDIEQLNRRLEAKIEAGKVPSKGLVRRIEKLKARLAGEEEPSDSFIDSVMRVHTANAELAKIKNAGGQ